MRDWFTYNVLIYAVDNDSARAERATITFEGILTMHLLLADSIALTDGSWLDIAINSISKSIKVVLDPTHSIVMGIWAAVFIILFTIDTIGHRKGSPTVRSALLWSLFYLMAGVGFAGVIWWRMDAEKAALYLSGYALEKTLAVDNLFVFLAIFEYFGIGRKEDYLIQQRILRWGVIGAVVFRFLFLMLIGLLINLPGRAQSVVLGILAVLVGFMAFGMCKKAFRSSDEPETIDFEANQAVRFAKWLFPVKAELAGGRFFVREGGKLFITVPFLIVACVEWSDIMFAWDSMPAVAAVTKDPVIMYTATMMAVLGLRALTFLLAAAARELHHLEKAVAILLVYIALKIAVDALELFKVPGILSFSIVLTCLGGGILASLAWPNKSEETPDPSVNGDSHLNPAPPAIDPTAVL